MLPCTKVLTLFNGMFAGSLVWVIFDGLLYALASMHTCGILFPLIMSKT